MYFFILKDGNAQKSRILLAIIVIVKTNEWHPEHHQNFALFYIKCRRSTRGSVSRADHDSMFNFPVKLVEMMLSLWTTL